MHLDDDIVSELVAIVSEAAEAEIMPRFRRLDPASVTQKTSTVDLVTEADIAAEKIITGRLLERFPGAFVVGEEAVADAPDLLEGLAGAELAFVIDPIDGTFNFASGLPLFGSMLAVLRNGETVAGIIHDPVGRDTVLAVRGGGAFRVTGEGERQRLRVADPVAVAEMNGSVSWQFATEPLRSRHAAAQAKFLSGFAYRCAAHEYRLLASGKVNFTLYHKLMPWDHLAGVLILEEAGGYAARFDGSAYRAGMTSGGLICATDRKSWQAVRQILFED